MESIRSQSNTNILSFLKYQKKKGKILVKEATKTKALFDFLYFQKRGLEKIDKKFIKELRLNLEEMQKSDWLEFEKYLEISRSKKMKKFLK